MLLSSLTGFRGTPNVSAYGATKSWNINLAEGAGTEMKSEGVDLMVCVAGATDTPGYRDSITKGSVSPMQKPEAVAREALRKLGHKNVMIPGFKNRVIAALVYKLIPRSWACYIFSRATSSLRKRFDAGQF